jgi:hypothetical protein
MSDAVESTFRTNSDGSVTVTVGVYLNGKDWTTVTDRIRALYSGRYVHWMQDAEGHDVFLIAAPVEVASLPCGLCAAGQPHSHSNSHGSYA